MKNPQYSFIRVKDYWIAIKFIHMTRNHLLFNFDKCRKAENEDSLQMWIGSYNKRLVALPRFFKGLQYTNIDDPKRRNRLSAIGRKSDCIIGIRHIKRKLIAVTSLVIYGHSKTIYHSKNGYKQTGPLPSYNVKRPLSTSSIDIELEDKRYCV
jgi:hypothetical protein